MARLLSRPQLLPDESLCSWLLRLQAANGYDALYLLTTLCGLPTHAQLPRIDRLSAKMLHRLAALTAMDALALWAASGHCLALSTVLPSQPVTMISVGTQTRPILQRPWTHHFRSYQRIQFCPRCLQDGHYHRRYWLPKLSECCVIHHCWLERHCTCCCADQPLSIRALLTGHCPNCAHDLAQLVPRPAAVDAVRYQLLLEHLWFGGHAAQIDTWVGLPEQPASVLLAFLTGCHDVATQHLLQTGLPESVCWQTKTVVLDAVCDWPHGFYRFLDRWRLVSDIDTCAQVRRLFGKLYAVYLERKWRSPAFDFVQLAFNQYVSQHFHLTHERLQLRRFRSDPFWVTWASYVTVGEAARILKCSAATVQQMVVAGQLTICPKPSPLHCDSTQALVQYYEVRLWQRRQRQSRSVKQVAFELGVPQSSIWAFVQAGFLRKLHLPHLPPDLSLSICPESLHHFQHQLAQTTDCVVLSHPLPFDRAVSAIRLYGGGTVTLVAAILAGTIRASAHSTTFVAMLVSRQDVARFILAIQQETAAELEGSTKNCAEHSTS